MITSINQSNPPLRATQLAMLWCSSIYEALCFSPGVI